MAYEKEIIDNNITLFRGDCLEVLPTISDESIDLIFIDPPYNVGQKFANENLKDEDYLILFKKWISELYRILKPTGAFYMTYYHKKLFDIGKILTSFDWTFANLIFGLTEI